MAGMGGAQAAAVKTANAVINEATTYVIMFGTSALVLCWYFRLSAARRVENKVKEGIHAAESRLEKKMDQNIKDIIAERNASVAAQLSASRACTVINASEPASNPFSSP